jgi:hypothetical protein
MPTYRYYACDTLTGEILAELPLVGVTFSIVVNDSGEFSATLPLAAAPYLVQVTQPGRTSVYIERDGVLVYGGIIWGRQYDATAGTMTLDGSDFLSYCDHLIISDNLNFAQIEQLAMFRSLVQYGMNKGGSDLSLAFLGATASGMKRDRTYASTDLSVLGDMLRNLSALDGGFDFIFGVRWEGDYPRRTVTLGYPSLGRPLAQSLLYFEYETDLSALTFSEDAASSASTIYAVGGVLATAPSGTLPPTYTADAQQVRASGMPRLESQLSFDDITQQATLNAHANGELTAIELPPMGMSVGFNSHRSNQPPVGSFLPGDQCMVIVSTGDLMFTDGATVLGTITSVDVTVTDEGDEQLAIGITPITVTPGPAGVTSYENATPVPPDEDLRVITGRRLHVGVG